MSDTFEVLATGDDGCVIGSGEAYPPPYTSTDTTSVSFSIQKTLIIVSYAINVGLCRWDTSALIDTYLVSSAQLKIYVTAKVDNDARNLVGEWYDTSNWPIGENDYTTTPSSTAFSIDITSLSAGWNTIDLTNVSSISKTGYTGMRFHIDGAAPAGTNLISIKSWDNGSLSPQLIVTSYDPYKNVADSITFTDSISKIVASLINVSDNFSLSEAEAILKIKVVSPTDSITFTDGFFLKKSFLSLALQTPIIDTIEISCPISTTIDVDGAIVTTIEIDGKIGT